MAKGSNVFIRSQVSSDPSPKVCSHAVNCSFHAKSFYYTTHSWTGYPMLSTVLSHKVVIMTALATLAVKCDKHLLATFVQFVM